MLRYPFIYICSLLRSGSTLLQELLIEKDNSYILHEPMLGFNVFHNRELIAKDLEEWGLSPELILEEDNISKIFQNISLISKQVGVKEIRNAYWDFYKQIFGDNICYVLIGRHPMDIYISCHYQMNRSNHWTPSMPPFNPAGLYGEVSFDIQAQIDMVKQGKCVKVKYEDLCNNKSTFENIKKYVNSPINEMGNVGELHEKLPRGDYENSIHKFKVTSKSVYRYKFEQDKKLLENAKAFYNLMSDYNEFWGY